MLQFAAVNRFDNDSVDMIYPIQWGSSPYSVEIWGVGGFWGLHNCLRDLEDMGGL